MLQSLQWEFTVCVSENLMHDKEQLTSSDASMSVKMILQLDAYLSVQRLFKEERMFQ